MPSKHETCRCRAYSFPHREGSGKCFASEPGPYCGNCGTACYPKEVDNGIGAYECHGAKGIHRKISIESDCCGAAVFSDASLTIEYQQ